MQRMRSATINPIGVASAAIDQKTVPGEQEHLVIDFSVQCTALPTGGGIRISDILFWTGSELLAAIGKTIVARPVGRDPHAVDQHDARHRIAEPGRHGSFSGDGERFRTRTQDEQGGLLSALEVALSRRYYELQVARVRVGSRGITHSKISLSPTNNCCNGTTPTLQRMHSFLQLAIRGGQAYESSQTFENVFAAWGAGFSLPGRGVSPLPFFFFFSPPAAAREEEEIFGDT